MPITWTKGSPQAFVSLGERLKDQLYRSLAISMVVIAQQAAITAQAFTASRGTEHSRGAGRIDSGAMAEAIEAKVLLSADEIIGKFGFLGDQADYFKYQTITGFKHWLSGEMIEPTFALRDAKVIAEGEVIEAIEAAIRSVKL